MNTLKVLLLTTDVDYAHKVESVLEILPGVHFLGHHSTLDPKELKQFISISNCLLIDCSCVLSSSFLRYSHTNHKLLVDQYQGSSIMRYKKILSFSADSYISNKNDFISLCKALAVIKTGKRFIDADMSDLLFGGDLSLLKDLSDREFDVLYELMLAKSIKQIADSLNIGQSTVKSHLDSIYSKLGTNSRFETLELLKEQIHMN